MRLKLCVLCFCFATASAQQTENPTVKDKAPAPATQPPNDEGLGEVPKMELPERHEGFKRVPRAMGAEIYAIDHQDPQGTWNVGNVIVVLADGKEEIWTNGGGYAQPKVALNGMAGWLWGVHKAKDGWASGGLRVVHNTKAVSSVKPSGAYVLAWNFVEDGAAVVIKSRGVKGDVTVEKFITRTGKIQGKFLVGKDDPNLAEEWVKPMLEEIRLNEP